MCDPEAVARAFHETYERLAPSYGYTTREASAVPWEQVPANNRALMVAVVAEIASLAESTSGNKAKRFALVRDIDVTGISGTGAVAYGVKFWDGTCVMRWHTHVTSMAIYASMADLIDIHGHNGSTRVEWIDL